MNTRVVIPFRDRGLDPRRAANLFVVTMWWWANGFEFSVVDDGGQEGEQFNRHRAYNKAVAQFPETDVFVFAEADMLVPRDQIELACIMALDAEGLVVPFSQYRYLSDVATASMRERVEDMSPGALSMWWGLPATHKSSLFNIEPESTMDNGRSIGAVNVVSRDTLDKTGGFTEATSGNWYDDNITEEAFAFLTGCATRWVDGPAVHMYHLPGHKGDHLTDEDRAATAYNKTLLTNIRRAIRSRDKGGVRKVMEVRQPW